MILVDCRNVVEVSGWKTITVDHEHLAHPRSSSTASSYGTYLVTGVHWNHPRFQCNAQMCITQAQVSMLSASAVDGEI